MVDTLFERNGIKKLRLGRGPRTDQTRQQTKDFLKFLGIVTILFVGMCGGDGIFLPHPLTLVMRQGFLTTFTMLARDSFTASQILWMMINVFFG